MNSKFEVNAVSLVSSALEAEKTICTECRGARKTRPWLLASSIFLNVILTITFITTVTIFTTAQLIPFDTSHSNSSQLSRRAGIQTSCILGLTETQVAILIASTTAKSYPGQSCEELGDAGEVPYYTTQFYEIAVWNGVENRNKARELLHTAEDSFGPEHMHWHPSTDDQRRESEARKVKEAFPSATHRHEKRELSGGAIFGIVAACVLFSVMVFAMRYNFVHWY